MRAFAGASLAAWGLLCALPAGAFDSSAPGAEDCARCHKLTPEEAQALLRPILLEGVQVQAVGEGELRGVWTVAVQKGEKKGVVYVDYAKKKVFTGTLMEIATKADLGQRHLADRNRVDFSRIPLDDAVVLGKSDAPKKVVIFADPECAFCSKLNAELKRILAARTDIAFFVKLVALLSVHPNAKGKAEAILCDRANGVRLLEDSFAGRALPPAACATQQIEENIRLAGELGVTGTPTLVLQDGRMVPGVVSADRILEMVDGKPHRASSKN